MMTPDEHEDLRLRTECRRWDCYALALAGGVIAGCYLLLTACIQ
jgi:hypothetical protein